MILSMLKTVKHRPLNDGNSNNNSIELHKALAIDTKMMGKRHSIQM